MIIRYTFLTYSLMVQAVSNLHDQMEATKLHADSVCRIVKHAIKLSSRDHNLGAALHVLSSGWSRSNWLSLVDLAG